MNIIAKTLMLTTKCTAGCSHCPFGKGEVDHRFLPIENVRNILKNFHEKMVVLSGGEPLEHPFFGEIIATEFAEDKLFRIATGGHLSLQPWLNTLKNHPNFDGISMGTDVISPRCHNKEHYKIWKQNIGLLNQHRISYSFTFTLGEDLGPIDKLVDQLKDLNPNPRFIYIRLSGAVAVAEMKELFSKLFPEVPLIFD